MPKVMELKKKKTTKKCKKGIFIQELINYTGGGGKSSRSQNPTQSSESKSPWMARKCKPPQAFFAASQASASFVVTRVFS
jgi:hypothetical protein